MAGGWHYIVSGQQHGPISSGELKRLADAGQLAPSDMVWKEGLASWMAASSVKGLFAAAATPPPLPFVGPPPSAPAELPPRVDVVARATVGATKAAMRSVAGMKPIAGFHIQRFGLGVAALLGCLCTFLPWITVPVIGTVYGTAGDGWITLILFIPAVVFAVLGDRLAPIGGWKRFAASIPPVLAALIGLGKIVDLNSRLADMRAAAANNPFGAAMAATVQTRIGLYLLVLAGAACAAAVFALKGDDGRRS